MTVFSFKNIIKPIFVAFPTPCVPNVDGILYIPVVSDTSAVPRNHRYLPPLHRLSLQWTSKWPAELSITVYPLST